MENATSPDLYETVLADLNAKKAQIDQAIAAIEALRGGNILSATATAAAGPARAGAANPVPATGPGAFLGMTVHEATKKLLTSQHRQMQTTEIVTELERGGVHLASADKVNTVGSILLRRFNTVGDIVRVSRGVWGLAEWYPRGKFGKAQVPPKPDEHEAPAETAQSEPDQNSASGGNVGETNPDKPIAAAAAWPHFKM